MVGDGALLVLGRVAKVERPALAALFPALRGEGRCLLLDAGANVECRPSMLCVTRSRVSSSASARRSASMSR